MLENTPNFAPLAGAKRTAALTTQLRDMLRAGDLPPGSKLPASRRLATDLGVARGTVVSALETLVAEGLLETRRGAGTFVSHVCCPTNRPAIAGRAPPLGKSTIVPNVDPPVANKLNFQACRPSLEMFSQTAWRRAAAFAATAQPSSDYGDPQGEPALRIAIAAYLCRARGLDIDPAEILVTHGAIQAIALLSALYIEPGDAVALEEPGYPLARQCFENAGATLAPVNVDADGFDVGQLDSLQGRVRLVYVTPSHQFPTGARLSLERRQQLLKWAVANDALILEDDYDGEFRYDIAPLAPMSAMGAGGFVMYLGTFSKTLFPALRIGYAAGDRRIIAKLAALRTAADYQTSALTQLTLARFIETGDFERHIFRTRKLYAGRRQCLMDALADSGLPGRLCGMSSGLNSLIRLDTPMPAGLIAEQARLAGITISPLSRYCIDPNSADNALVFGYAAASESDIQTGVHELARIVKAFV
ncbi:MAG: PLP-dependent aminotransferase family protein [Pseudomonadota bacterium]